MMQHDTLESRELTRLSVRRCVRFLLIWEVIYIVLYALVLNPLYTNFVRDILYRDAWWLNMIGLFIDLSEYIIPICCYPACLYALWKGGWRYGYPTSAWLTGLTVFKFMLNYVVGVRVYYDAWPSLEMLAEDIPLILPSLLLELLQLAVVLGLWSLRLWLYRVKQINAAAEAALRQKPYTAPSVLPLTELFDGENPLQRSLFDAALAVTAMSLLLRRLVYQLTLYAANGKTDGWLQITVDVVGDLIVGVVMYLVGILLLDRFAKRDAQTGENS